METLKLLRCFIVVKNEDKLFQRLDAKNITILSRSLLPQGDHIYLYR